MTTIIYFNQTVPVHLYDKYAKHFEKMGYKVINPTVYCNTQNEILHFVKEQITQINMIVMPSINKRNCNDEVESLCKENMTIFRKLEKYEYIHEQHEENEI